MGFVALFDSAEGQFWAARALRKIASKNTANKVAIVEAGGIQVFVDLVANGSGDFRPAGGREGAAEPRL